MANSPRLYRIDPDSYRELYDIVYSLKIETERSVNTRNDFDQIDVFRVLSMKLDSIRFLIRSLRLASNRSRKHETARGILLRVIEEAESLHNDVMFKEHFANKPFRYITPPSNNGRMVKILGTSEPTKSHALRHMIDTAKHIYSIDAPTVDDPSPSEDTMQLRRIVPGQQKIGPVQFDFVDDRLVIAHVAATPREGDTENALSARSMLIQNGQRIIENLQQSNCDKRLLETVEALQQKLVLEQDIIQLGIMNIGCEMMAGAFSQELPDAVSAMLKAQTTSVGLYVAQFEEWSRFAANAAAVELTTDDIARVSKTATHLVEKLSETPGTVDPEVPKTIALLQALISDPTRASKRAAYAVIRTIENLVAKVFSYGANFIDQVVTETSKKVATSVSRVVTVALLSLAVEGAFGLGPIVAKLGDGEWMKNAAQIVQRQIDQLKE